MNPKPHILVTPLNWGLGHATRCSMIIDALLERGWKVGIGTSGIALTWLKQRYPELVFHELPDYGITYQRKGSFMLRLLRLAPSIFKKIDAENKQVEYLVQKFGYTGIISDNRFGTHHKKIPTVFMTHQLHVIVPLGGAVVRWMNGRYIKNFSRCWIPDFEEPSKRLAGILSKPLPSMNRYQFIGPLSPFKGSVKRSIKYTYMALLSGPEPQRTMLEEKVFAELQATGKKCLLVRGTEKPGGYPSTANVEVIDLLSSEEVEQNVSVSDVIICRSGYSTIMDLCLMGKKAIFIPTPGQSEQEYIGERMRKMGYSPSLSQRKFNLSVAAEMLELCSGLPKLGPYRPPFGEMFKIFEG